MAKKEQSASKHDLLLVLKSIDDSETAEMKRLRLAMEDANSALEDFQHSNAEYMRLNGAAEKASKRYYACRGRHRDNRRELIRTVRNAVWLKGACPETVAMVEKLIKEYGPTFSG